MGYTAWDRKPEQAMNSIVTTLSERIQALTSEQLAEVEVFLDLLQRSDRDAPLSHALTVLSEPAFETIWSNPEDDAYDAL